MYYLILTLTYFFNYFVVLHLLNLNLNLNYINLYKHEKKTNY